MEVVKQPPSPGPETCIQAEDGGEWKKLRESTERRCSGMKKVSSTRESKTDKGGKWKGTQDRKGDNDS